MLKIKEIRKKRFFFKKNFILSYHDALRCSHDFNFYPSLITMTDLMIDSSSHFFFWSLVWLIISQ